MKVDISDHIERRIDMEVHTKSKISYTTENLGPLNNVTEYNKEFPGYINKIEHHKFAHPNNLKNEGPMFINPTTADHFKGHSGDQALKQAHLKEKNLLLTLKNEGRFGHMFKSSEEHKDKYVKNNAPPSEAIQQPAKWFKDRYVHQQNIPLDLYHKNRPDVRGHSQDLAKKQTERFDNLRTGKPTVAQNLSSYRREFQGEEVQEVKTKALRLTQELGRINENLNSRESKVFRNPEWKNDTTYTRDYCSVQGGAPRSKSVYGRNPALGELVTQFHKGYFYKD